MVPYELYEKLKKVKFYTGESYKLLESCKSYFMSHDDLWANDKIFETLDIKDPIIFCTYFYETTGGAWPVCNSKEDLEGLYKCVQELLLRSYLKSQGLKYNFDDCVKEHTKIYIRTKFFSVAFLLKDNRCLLDSVSIHTGLTLRKMLLCDYGGTYEDIAHIEIITEKPYTIFKVGDIVKVAKRKYKACEYPYDYVDDMACYEGELAKITDVIPNDYENNDFELTGDEALYIIEFLNKDNPLDEFKWSSPMLEKVDITTIEYDLNDTIICKDKYLITTDVIKKECVEKPIHIQIKKHKINFKIQNPV